MPNNQIKIVTVVGARPQFIKAAVISHAIATHNASKNGKLIKEILVHTGQHYDYEMSQIFFDQLDLPKPDYDLDIGSGSHGDQTGRMMIRLEEVLIKEKPDWVLVYGDTNSTLAGALTASKLYIPVAHAEAGLRSFNRHMPEEINRVVADHLSALLFAPTPTAVENLKKEGITRGVKEVPDLMEESLYSCLKIAQSKSTILKKLELNGKYYLATVHRSENTDNRDRLSSILTALKEIAKVAPVVLPLHPRTKKILEGDAKLNALTKTLRIMEPVSYIDMLLLESNATAILTDSGGVQKEAFWLKVPCITLRDETEWLETVQSGLNIVTGTNTKQIVAIVLSLSTSQNPLTQKIAAFLSAGAKHILHFLETNR